MRTEWFGMSARNRCLIVVNKYWECDPVCWALTNGYLRERCDVKLPWPRLLTYPSYGPVKSQTPAPRLIYATEGIQVEVWCISDMLSKFEDKPKFQSSSERKIEVLGAIFDNNSMPVKLVAAVGTASSGPFYPMYQGAEQGNINGSVVVGSKVFMHDGHPEGNPNPDSKWRCNYFDHLMDSSFSDISMLKKMGADNLETAMLSPPTNPASNGQHIYASDKYIAIGDVNVTDYGEYEKKDKEAGKCFLDICQGNTNGVSLETTHGLIYATARNHFQADPPFLFVSGVVDRFTSFKEDVGPKPYAQNVTGAHNAGVVVAQLVADLLKN